MPRETILYLVVRLKCLAGGSAGLDCDKNSTVSCVVFLSIDTADVTGISASRIIYQNPYRLGTS